MQMLLLQIIFIMTLLAEQNEVTTKHVYVAVFKYMYSNDQSSNTEMISA